MHPRPAKPAAEPAPAVVFRAEAVLPAESRARRRAELLEYLRTHDAACPRCGYSLRGLAGVQCPECAWVFDLALLRGAEAAAATPRRLPWSVRWLTIGLAGAYTVTMAGLAVGDGSVALAVGALFSGAGFVLGLRWFGPRPRPAMTWRANAARLAVVWALVAVSFAHRVVFP
jgi:hypothetical protein